MRKYAAKGPWRLPAAMLAVLASVFPAVQVRAGEEHIAVELNRVSAAEGACRLSLVFTNHLAVPVEALAIETVIFDRQGSVERFVVLKSRPLTPGKIRVQQFDMRGIPCEGIGKLLLNDVTECKAGDLAPAACLEKIAVTSRAGVPFVSTAVSN